MKKLIILIMPVICCVSCFGQRVALSTGVSVNIIGGMTAINKDEFSAYGNTKFNHSKLATEHIATTVRLANKNAHFYKRGNVLIQLVNSDVPVKDSHLSELKKRYDNMNRTLKDSNHYTSLIKDVNNNHVLIMYDDWQNIGYYNVHCWSNNYTHGVTIGLQFDLADKADATRVLHDLLNTVQFKN